MLWAPYLFIVYYGPKVLKLVAVGIFGGLLVGGILSLVSLTVSWFLPGVTYIFSAVLFAALALVG